MSTSTDVPDEEREPMLDRGVRRHLGLGLRVMYEQEAPILPNNTIDYAIDRMEAQEPTIQGIADRIRMRVEVSGEDSFPQHPLLTALAQLIHSNRFAAYQVLSNALIVLGPQIKRWGGIPQFVGMSNEESLRQWRALATTSIPSDEKEWEWFLSGAGAFVYALMVRHRTAPAFWAELRRVAHGTFERAIGEYCKTL